MYAKLLIKVARDPAEQISPNATTDQLSVVRKYICATLQGLLPNSITAKSFITEFREVEDYAAIPIDHQRLTELFTQEKRKFSAKSKKDAAAKDAAEKDDAEKDAPAAEEYVQLQEQPEQAPKEVLYFPSRI